MTVVTRKVNQSIRRKSGAGAASGATALAGGGLVAGADDGFAAAGAAFGLAAGVFDLSLVIWGPRARMRLHKFVSFLVPFGAEKERILEVEPLPFVHSKLSPESMFWSR